MVIDLLCTIMTERSSLVLLLLVRVGLSVQDGPVVQTASGPVRGLEVPGENGVQAVFYSGIPYAEAPLGPLRFGPPVPVSPWTEVHHEEGKIPRCVQHPVSGHVENLNDTREDCLKLNLVVPSPAPANASVLIYVHGGAFSVGSGIRNPQFVMGLVAEEKIIVASMDYRLNVFGFAGLGMPEAPGNVGLLDQRLAILWIKDNIRAFGGNPDSITLMGMSAGAASIGYHLMTQQNEGLFQRAILMSGTAGGHMHYEPEQIHQKTSRLAGTLGCDTANHSSILHCLQKVPVEMMMQAEAKIKLAPDDFFRPTVDGSYVTEHPHASLASGRFLSDIPVLVGVTSNEGSRFFYGLNKEMFKNPECTLSSDELRTVFQRMLSRDGVGAEGLEAALIYYANLSHPDDEESNRDSASMAYGDRIFVCSVNSFCDRLFKAGATVYKYVYDQKILGLTRLDWMGPEHSTDLPVVVGHAALTRPSTDQEAQFSRRVMKQWAAFVRTGDPNVPGDGSPKWPRFNLARRPHMRLAFESEVQNHYRVQECSFWDKLLPILRSPRCKTTI